MTVVMDDPPTHAAIVVFVVDADAAAREFHSARDDAMVVVILVVFPVDELPARRGLTCKVTVCVHAIPSFRHCLGVRRNAERRRTNATRGRPKLYGSRAGTSGDRGVTRLG